MSAFLTESTRREQLCSKRSTETLIQWAVISGAFYGGSIAMLHQFYEPFRRVNFRFKVIPACMLTLGTAYFKSEQALMACRREQGQLEYQQERQQRVAKFAEMKRLKEAEHEASISHTAQGQPVPTIKSPSTEHHRNF